MHKEPDLTKSSSNDSEIKFDQDLEYCGLNLPLDNREAVIKEILDLRPKMHGLEISPNWYEGRQKFPALGPPEAYENYRLKGPARDSQHRSKARSMWSAINLTTSPQFPNSARVSVLDRRKAAEASWSWNPHLKLEETKRLVDRLEPTELILARAMLMPAGHLAFFHVDGKNAWDLGYQQVNIHLRTGGSSFVIRLKGHFREIHEDVFSFNDRNLHGVPQVSSDRLILVLTGKFAALSRLAKRETYVSRSRHVQPTELPEYRGNVRRPLERSPKKHYNHLVFAKLNAPAFPMDLFAREILQYEKQMKPSYLSTTWVQPDQYESLPLLADADRYARIHTLDPKTKKTIFVPDGAPTFRGLNFTVNSASAGPMLGLSNRSDMVSEKWRWNEKLPIPNIRNYLERELGLIEPVICRALLAEAGGFVPFHKDAGRLELQNAQYRQVNLEIYTGGSTLHVYFRGKLFSASTRVYSFKDLFFHGVPETKTKRLVLVVCGRFDNRKWDSLIDENAIYEK